MRRCPISDIGIWDIRDVSGASILSSRRIPGAFSQAPTAVRLYVVAAILLAVALPLWLDEAGVTVTKNDLRATVLVLVVVSALNVELGRLVEGGLSHGQRPHKALSTWAFCSALLLPLPWLLPVVALSYAHVRWRGMRVPLWKWVGSASFVTLAAVPAGIAAHRVNGGDPNLMNDNGGWGLLGILAATAVFLVVETALFHGIAYLNDAEDEAWLRRTLAGRSFYLTEASVLLMGALSAAVWTSGAWFLLLLIPVYGLAQRAVMHEPLREKAETDDKTGLLRFESWRSLAVAEQRRCELQGRPWSLAFADLDHFKAYNDAYGHLSGDAALAAVAGSLRGQVRGRDLVGRFGGEEFCVFLPDTAAPEAAVVAERLRAAVADLDLPGTDGRATVSIGMVTRSAGGQRTEFIDALTAADRALFTAKMSGRDQVCLSDLATAPSAGGAAADVALPTARPAD
jgi:diguanylate cyclase (GGDEF)-like protein